MINQILVRNLASINTLKNIKIIPDKLKSLATNPAMTDVFGLFFIAFFIKDELVASMDKMKKTKTIVVTTLNGLNINFAVFVRLCGIVKFPKHHNRVHR